MKTVDELWNGERMVPTEVEIIPNAISSLWRYILCNRWYFAVRTYDYVDEYGDAWWQMRREGTALTLRRAMILAGWALGEVEQEFTTAPLPAKKRKPRPFDDEPDIEIPEPTVRHPWP